METLEDFEKIKYFTNDSGVLNDGINYCNYDDIYILSENINLNFIKSSKADEVIKLLEKK